MHPFFTQHPTPRLFAHRGASGYRPENTIPSFALGLEMGAPYLELDVRMTRDGHVVVIHDEMVDRTTNGRGRVQSMSLRDLRQLDAAYRFERGGGDYPFRDLGISVPSLSEVLERFPGAMLNIELKQKKPPMEEALYRVLDGHDAMNRVLLASEHEEILGRVRAGFGTRAATGISRREGLRFARWFLWRRRGKPIFGGMALQIPARLAGMDYITTGLVEAAHALGLEVHVWTVNDPARMKRFLGLGADGIMTDYPDAFPLHPIPG
jgi:glycerophosphoryl diester phosphodiesterase